MRFAVTRTCARPDSRLFCSPWLRSADGNIEHQAALGRFRARMTTAIAASTVEARLAEGNVLLADNRRVLLRLSARSRRRRLLSS